MPAFWAMTANTKPDIFYNESDEEKKTGLAPWTAMNDRSVNDLFQHTGKSFAFEIYI